MEQEFPPIPEEISILGRKIKIIRDSNLLHEVWQEAKEETQQENDVQLLGTWDDYEQYIIISSSIPDRTWYIWSVLLHEVVHVIDSISVLEGKLSENDIDRIANGFLSCFMSLLNCINKEGA